VYYLSINGHHGVEMDENPRQGVYTRQVEGGRKRQATSYQKRPVRQDHWMHGQGKMLGGAVEVEWV
jgi:hypothetical protein